MAERGIVLANCAHRGTNRFADAQPRALSVVGHLAIPTAETDRGREFAAHELQLLMHPFDAAAVVQPLGFVQPSAQLGEPGAVFSLGPMIQRRTRVTQIPADLLLGRPQLRDSRT